MPFPLTKNQNPNQVIKKKKAKTILLPFVLKLGALQPQGEEFPFTQNQFGTSFIAFLILLSYDNFLLPYLLRKTHLKRESFSFSPALLLDNYNSFNSGGQKS